MFLKVIWVLVKCYLQFTSLLITFAKTKYKNSPMKFCTSQCKIEYEIFYHMLLQAPSLDCISTDSVDFQLLVNKMKTGHLHQPWHKHCKNVKLACYLLRKLKTLKNNLPWKQDLSFWIKRLLTIIPKIGAWALKAVIHVEASFHSFLYSTNIYWVLWCTRHSLDSKIMSKKFFSSYLIQNNHVSYSDYHIW